MIVKMKKLTLLCLASSRVETVNFLAELGAVQVVNGKLEETHDRQTVANELLRLDRVIGGLSAIKPTGRQQHFSTPGKVLLGELDAKLVAADAARKEIDQLTRQRELLLPWGDFSPEQLNKLRKQGVYVALCILTKEEFADFAAPENAAVTVVETTRSQVRFAVSGIGMQPDNLPLAVIPDTKSLSEVDERLAELNAESAELQNTLAESHGALTALRDYQAKILNEYEFLACRDGMTEFGEIAVMYGFVPVTAAEKLSAEARKHGWGLVLEDPSEEDMPPILLDLPKWVEPLRPLLEFLGIMPGYREIDISFPMLVFMTVFFAMLVNDAGYGMIFLAASLWGVWHFRRSPKGRQASALVVIFSIATIAWGMAAGSWFGVEAGGCDFLTDPQKRNGNLIFVCFTLAVTQLSLGHLCLLFKSLKPRNIICQIAWIMVLVGFYLLAVTVVAYPDMKMPECVKYLIGIGTGLLMVFKVEWKDVGSVFNFPFEIINCFTDTLSYIRLFAVGMSGGYMAMCFNGMVADIFASGRESLLGMLIAVPCGILIVVVAHSLNIALGLIAVLVHGVRLNTLEFSNHVGLTWSGAEYRPLKKR